MREYISLIIKRNGRIQRLNFNFKFSNEKTVCFSFFIKLNQSMRTQATQHCATPHKDFHLINYVDVK